MAFEVRQKKVKGFGTCTHFPESINMQSASAIITNGLIGRNTFLKLLREYNLLDKNNKPPKEYISAGYFEGEAEYWNGNALQFIPRVTRSGIDFIKSTIPDFVLTPIELIENE